MAKTAKAEIYEVDPSDIKVSTLADITPSMDDSDYIALLEDVRSNGQITPVLVYRGKIVDGRHRKSICEELGMKLRCKNLPYKMTLREVQNMLTSIEMRKNKTRSQKAIMAYRYAVKEGVKQNIAAKKFGVSPQELSCIKNILAYSDGEEIINDLFQGKAAEIRIATGKRVISKRLSTLLSALRDKDTEKRKGKGSQELALLLEQSRINDRACSASLETLVACHEIRMKELKAALLKVKTMGEDYIEQETADSKYGKDITE